MARNKDVIERCNRYLNDNMNMVESFEKLTEDFMFDITILDQKNAKDIVEEYSDYVMMLRSTYRDYRFNVENFERYVLRLNSVISSSLIIEYRVHDLLYDNYSVLKVENRNVTQKEFLEKQIAFVKDLMNKFKDDEELMQEFTQMLPDYEERLKEIKKQEEVNRRVINKYKKDYYFIGNISKDKDLKDLIGQISQIYIENELIRAVREDIYKKHKIVIQNESKNKIHCLKMGAYGITSDKIAKVMTLSLQNYQKNVIEDETLKLFNIFLYYNGVTNDKQYKDILKKYKQEVVKEIEATKTKYYKFGDLIKDYTITILKELRWHISE